MFCTYLCFSLLCRKAINYINHVMLNYRKYSKQFNLPHTKFAHLLPQNHIRRVYIRIYECTQH